MQDNQNHEIDKRTIDTYLVLLRRRQKFQRLVWLALLVLLFVASALVLIIAGIGVSRLALVSSVFALAGGIYSLITEFIYRKDAYWAKSLLTEVSLELKKEGGESVQVTLIPDNAASIKHFIEAAEKVEHGQPDTKD